MFAELLMLWLCKSNTWVRKVILGLFGSAVAMAQIASFAASEKIHVNGEWKAAYRDDSMPEIMVQRGYHATHVIASKDGTFFVTSSHPYSLPLFPIVSFLDAEDAAPTALWSASWKLIRVFPGDNECQAEKDRCRYKALAISPDSSSVLMTKHYFDKKPISNLELFSVKDNKAVWRNPFVDVGACGYAAFSSASSTILLICNDINLYFGGVRDINEAYRSGGERTVSSSQVLVFDSMTGNLKDRLNFGEAGSNVVFVRCISSDAKRIVTLERNAAGSQAVYIRNLSEPEKRVMLTDRPVSEVKFSPESRHLVVMLTSGVAQLWDAYTTTAIAEFQYLDEEGMARARSARETFISTMRKQLADQSGYGHNVPDLGALGIKDSAEYAYILFEQNANMLSVTSTVEFAPDKSAVFFTLSLFDNVIRKWFVAKNEIRKNGQWPLPSIEAKENENFAFNPLASMGMSSVAVLPSGSKAAVVQGGKRFLVDTKEDRLINIPMMNFRKRNVIVHDVKNKSILFETDDDSSDNNRHFWLVHLDGRRSVSHVAVPIENANGSEKQTWKRTGAATDGNFVLTANDIYDIRSGEHLMRLNGMCCEYTFLEKKGSVVGVSHAGDSLCVWSAEKHVKNYECPIKLEKTARQGRFKLAVSPDGDIVALGEIEPATGYSVRLYDLHKGTLLKSWREERSSAVNPTFADLKFSPSGKSVAIRVMGYDSTNSDFWIWDWNVSTSTPVRSAAKLPGALGAGVVPGGSEPEITFIDEEHISVLNQDYSPLMGGRVKAKVFNINTGSSSVIKDLCGEKELCEWRLVSFSANHQRHASNVGSLYIYTGSGGAIRIVSAGATSFDLRLLLITEDGVRSHDREIGDSGAWIVIDGKTGRFDANNVQRLSLVHWIMPDDRVRPLPVEVFIRDFYEPGLLPRFVAGGESAFRPVGSVGLLNRIRPNVQIIGVRRGPSPDLAIVDVKLSAGKDAMQPNGKTTTGVYDLRVFRDGKLVSSWPITDSVELGHDTKSEWMRDTLILSEEESSEKIISLPIRLRSNSRGQAVRFSAYAFNEDRIKTETSFGADYIVPPDIAMRKPMAYLILVGANIYESGRNLRYAAKDAKNMALALSKIQGYDVVTINLLSETGEGSEPLYQATKENIHAVFELLAGKSQHKRERLKAVRGINVAELNRLDRATPDDLVFIAFSGHGYTEPNGRFYLIPSDSGKYLNNSPENFLKWISSEELALWLRDIDAGEMTMVVDACHAAGSLGLNFKPGPMGDRSLGQLAYDKGMMILAATQSDNVALEVSDIEQGLLTFALVHDGFSYKDDKKQFRNSDLNNDGKVTLREWLRYGEQRVPTLYDDIEAGKVFVSNTSLEIGSSFRNFIIEMVNQAQTPLLFDFRGYETETPVMNTNP